ncbi:hypothetical protein [Noviherbaspirillum saxi]|uniref:Polysaccharide lyase n=1 Tax=Noviherbaspirillum saxi TaxID=2320863 RepID=A0A3A3FM28_9BURK|nr:hypothetical protein [Noviherbaspirillum saxi]RJF97277.1 hypothetical protein D3871_01045 [Noviherbaspirillum saxi]
MIPPRPKNPLGILILLAFASGHAGGEVSPSTPIASGLRVVRLNADGITNPYTQIDKALGRNSVEVPDCGHAAFGPHITQQISLELGKPVFAFHLHANPDNDRCGTFDRQRTEIKVHSGSPDYLKGFNGDTVSFRWRFKLATSFVPSRGFTHIHQIKPGDDRLNASPILTLTPRGGRDQQLEIIHVDGNNRKRVLASTSLAPFKGQWIDAHERISYSHHGHYALVLRDMNGTTLYAYQMDDLDLWRTDATFMRPKWGIYRSLEHKAMLRDESILFSDFCLAKARDDC